MTADQIPLFLLCDICGHPHIDPREHSACRVALDRWYRSENLNDWMHEPNRAVL